MKDIIVENKIAKKIEFYIKKYDSNKLPYQKFKALCLVESQGSTIKDFHKSLVASNSDKDIKKVFEAFKKELNEDLVDNNEISYLINSGQGEFLKEEKLDNDDEFDIGNFSSSNDEFDDVSDNTFSYDDDLGKTHEKDNFHDEGLDDNSNAYGLNESLDDDETYDVGSNEFNFVNESDEINLNDLMNEDEMDSTDNARANSTLDNDVAIPDFQDNYMIDGTLDECRKNLKEADDSDAGGDVEYVDKPTLFADLVSVENNMSDAFNSLYPYKFEYIDDPRIKKALRELRVNISDTLTKVTQLISMVGLEKDIISK